MSKLMRAAAVVVLSAILGMVVAVGMMITSAFGGDLQFRTDQYIPPVIIAQACQPGACSNLGPNSSVFTNPPYPMPVPIPMPVAK